MEYRRPLGNRLFHSRMRALMRSATSRAFEPGNWKMASPAAGLPSNVSGIVLVLGSRFDPRHVLEIDDFPGVAILEDDVAKLLGLGHRPRVFIVYWKSWPLGTGGWPVWPAAT